MRSGVSVSRRTAVGRHQIELDGLSGQEHVEVDDEAAVAVPVRLPLELRDRDGWHAGSSSSSLAGVTPWGSLGPARRPT
jgi:hypothetical protein